MNDFSIAHLKAITPHVMAFYAIRINYRQWYDIAMRKKPITHHAKRFFFIFLALIIVLVVAWRVMFQIFTSSRFAPVKSTNTTKNTAGDVQSTGATNVSTGTTIDGSLDGGAGNGTVQVLVLSGDVLSYNDPIEKFSLSYPKEFSLASNEALTLQSQSVKIIVPKSIQPQTNFSEASVSVTVSKDPATVKKCLVAPVASTAKAKRQVINKTVYSVFHDTDAGAGNFYESTRYHTVHNKKCVMVESLIHSSNIGMYSPDQGITAFDQKAVTAILDTIIGSFRL